MLPKYKVRCDKCGAEVEYDVKSEHIVCPYCGNQIDNIDFVSKNLSENFPQSQPFNVDPRIFHWERDEDEWALCFNPISNLIVSNSIILPDISKKIDIYYTIFPYKADYSKDLLSAKDGKSKSDFGFTNIVAEGMTEKPRVLYDLELNIPCLTVGDKEYSFKDLLEDFNDEEQSLKTLCKMNRPIIDGMVEDCNNFFPTLAQTLYNAIFDSSAYPGAEDNFLKLVALYDNKLQKEAQKQELSSEDKGVLTMLIVLGLFAIIVIAVLISCF
jgi:predicted RNA-binding Zn-ribbon protein involved in translation (DUF1610 family)